MGVCGRLCWIHLLVRLHHFPPCRPRGHELVSAYLNILRKVWDLAFIYIKLKREWADSNISLAHITSWLEALIERCNCAYKGMFFDVSWLGSYHSCELHIPSKWTVRKFIVACDCYTPDKVRDISPYIWWTCHVIDTYSTSNCWKHFIDLVGHRKILAPWNDLCLSTS